MQVVELLIEDIRIGERFRKDLGDLNELVDSIRNKGLIQPITVSHEHILIAGQRRLAASRMAGLTHIQCIVRTIDDDLDLREVELHENIHRLDMSWHERARLERRIFDLRLEKDPKWSLAKQATLTDASKAAIRRRIELAHALDVVPELETLEKEDHAWKRYGRLQEEVVVAAMANDAENKYKEACKYAESHYHIGDAFAGMKELNANSMHFAEVDPPYAIGLEKRKRRNVYNNVRSYREVEEDDYGKFVKDMAALVYRCLRPNTFCVWWYASEWFAVVYDTLAEVGFQVTPVPAIWNKGQTGQTTSPDTMLASSYEPFFVARKGQPKLRKAGRSNVFDFQPTPPHRKIHPTARPVGLMQEILRTFTYPGATVVVPFLGSGSTLRACYKEGMVGFGWDLDETIKARFIVKVQQDKMEEDRIKEAVAGTQHEGEGDEQNIAV
jgi:adenine-specific DNA-methyltransferase